MKKVFQSFILLLAALLPLTAIAVEQLASGVYRDGSTLYITSGVTTLGPLQVNPSVIYSFAATPPACVENTFTDYGATLHMPATSYGAYFVNEYWGNFANMYNDAVEPTGVTISYNHVELLVGNVFNLTAIVTPANASLTTVEWSSSDPQVATVSGRQVVALCAGECDIVVSCLDKQAVCHVTVLDPISVTLDQTSVTIEKTQQVTLTATVTPEGATSPSLTWSTTDTNVATVNDGVVSGVGVGECDIIASYLDKQAVCHVTVVDLPIYITLDRHEAKLLPNHALTLTPTMLPIATTLKVTSTSPDVAGARLVNGVVQVVGLTEGTTLIVVSSVDGLAVPDTCQVTVYTECGDVNCDGYITISDVTSLINYLLNDDASGISLINADTDQSGKVNIGDVTTLINFLLVGQWPWDVPVTETFTVNGVTFKMVVVEGGTFTMGATSEQGGDAYGDEKPAHQVTLSGYSIGETEVTQALWQAVMGSNPSSNTGNLLHPVESVSWNDCQSFITKLNQLTGRIFRLPTEAEWEFAARGGNHSQGYKYSGSNDINDVAWYSGNSNYATHPVSTKAPNELGLYDMSGNVWEWCQDWYNSYSSEAQNDPTGPATGSQKVHRGGCNNNSARQCRVSGERGRYPQTIGGSGEGLRLALELE